MHVCPSTFSPVLHRWRELKESLRVQSVVGIAVGGSGERIAARAAGGGGEGIAARAAAIDSIRGEGIAASVQSSVVPQASK